MREAFRELVVMALKDEALWVLLGVIALSIALGAIMGTLPEWPS
jgi:hypothetical protein